MPNREEIAKRPIPHSEVVAAVSERLGDCYPTRLCHLIVDEYVRVLMQAVGTGRPVTIRQLGTMWIEVHKPRRRGNRSTDKKEPFRVTPKVRLNYNGSCQIRRTLRVVNHVVNLAPNEAAVRVLSKRW